MNTQQAMDRSRDLKREARQRRRSDSRWRTAGKVLCTAAAIAGLLAAVFGLFEPKPAEAARPYIVHPFIRDVVLASRNAGGTYSLPSGNPVTAGAIITSSWANNTLSDLATEMTDSLNRSGKGGMLASLKLANGTTSEPSFAWTSEINSGIYRAGAGDIRMVVAATRAQTWTSTGSSFQLPLTTDVGLTANSTTGNAIVATGFGSGKGVKGTGGGTNGPGVEGVGGATNGIGVMGTGTGTGSGVEGTGASSTTGIGVKGTGGSSSGVGVSGVGGATNGIGLLGTGTGSGSGIQAQGGATGAGGAFSHGTDATAGTRQDAIIVNNGDIKMDAVTNPSSTTAHKNRLGPKNIVKAHAKILVGSGTPSVVDGFNIASVACSSSSVQVTFAQAFAGTDYTIVASISGAAAVSSAYCNNTSTTVADCIVYVAAGQFDLCSFGTHLSIIATGDQ